MIILGIDPGTTSIGYALIRNDGIDPELLATGTVKITSSDTVTRLKELNSGINKIIKQWTPGVVATEKLFFAKNQKTALAVAEARGVILLTTALAGLKFYEYTPLEIKMVVTGDGRADKKQVKKMVQLIVPASRSLRARDDIFDAIAIAMACHIKERLWRGSKLNL